MDSVRQSKPLVHQWCSHPFPCMSDYCKRTTLSLKACLSRGPKKFLRWEKIPGNFLFAGKHFETPKGNFPASAKCYVHSARCSAFRALQTTCKINAHEIDTQCAAWTEGRGLAALGGPNKCKRCLQSHICVIFCFVKVSRWTPWLTVSAQTWSYDTTVGFYSDSRWCDQEIKRFVRLQNSRDECCGSRWRSNMPTVSGWKSQVVVVGTGLFQSKEQLQIGPLSVMESRWLPNNGDTTQETSLCHHVCPPVFTHPRAHTRTHIELGAVASGKVHVWVENSGVFSEFTKCTQRLQQVLKDPHQERRRTRQQTQSRCQI